MPLTFYPEDNEWASATGSNVYNGGNTSQFDYPPIAMYDMVITAAADDPEPRIFNIGDTYDIEYKVAGFDVSMQDAVVIRSDAAPNDGGIVIFEGTNNFGQIEHLVWTPGFDLESWYWDHFSGGQPPGFYIADTDPGYVHTFVCFSSDTSIDTPSGPRPAGTLAVGDLVDTRDDGAMPIRWIGRRGLVGVGPAAPIVFRPEAWGNAQTVRLSQQHRVFLQSAKAELYYGMSEVLVPAKGLVDGSTVHYAAQARIDYVHFLFDDHVLISAGGMWCESLLLGPCAIDLIDGRDVPRSTPGFGCRLASRPILSFHETASLMPHRVPGAVKQNITLI